jgi:CDP-glucose 4,6-dehydratase
MTPNFWSDKRVFLTGHTGFKGAWLAIWLEQIGARVAGYSLNPPSQPNLFEVAKVGTVLAKHWHADVRDLAKLQAAVNRFEPDILFHLAAQSLVRESYAHPIDTYSTNVMGTANLLEVARRVPSLRVVVVATSDKCYDNREPDRAHREDDAMGGYDPYSSSKGAAELVTAAYAHSFFETATSKCGVASVRAGNVIGGGDWAKDRLMADVMRGLIADRPITIRQPRAVRPWQHVLDPLAGYLSVAEKVWAEASVKWEGWNFGPDSGSERPVEEVATLSCSLWGRNDLLRINEDLNAPHEAITLKLDSTKARSELGWVPRWPFEEAVARTIEWYRHYMMGEAMLAFTRQQIAAYQDATDHAAASSEKTGNRVHA